MPLSLTAKLTYSHLEKLQWKGRKIAEVFIFCMIMNCFGKQSTTLKAEPLPYLTRPCDALCDCLHLTICLVACLWPESISKTNGWFGMKCAVHIHAPYREKPFDFCDPTFLKSHLEVNPCLLSWHTAWVVSNVDSQKRRKKCTQVQYQKYSLYCHDQPTSFKQNSISGAFDCWDGFNCK